MGGVGVPPRQSARQVGGLISAELVGGVDVGLPAACLPAFDSAVSHPQDRLFRIRILFPVRRTGRAVHDGDTRAAHRQRRCAQVVVRVIDDDQQVPQRICWLPGKRRAVCQDGPQQRDELVGIGRQIAGRAQRIEAAGNVHVR
ncbi:Uncharacterised protein [Mycobacterium tuberculosis]|uniref:Uncharacterized protein n=1 Tax=Mycobacterium tuberculosis TaxID=1773 RepID=A0A655FWK6_MYCTX|nr:Uncharacterised protein [Mycobacterium tuberculosis]CKN67151.1 Uncharacterised protein [Mycobacterium tuberculosis]CKQ85807.1 Uncharacterised protein [Mycobacterium tuberculosis]CKS95387.1 Uncharacterised protein [Mycobacterium tuberculosis]CKT65416.1 Uncharacterised protein [Mycobacterium tuberculosis]